MYQLTDNPDIVLRLSDSAAVPRGHRWWEEYEAWLALGNAPASMPETLADLVSEAKALISAWLDEVVQANGYDNIVSCASYATSTNAKFKAEAEAAIAWRDAVYSRGYELLAAIPDGVTTPEQVIELMPRPAAFGWPE